MLTLQELYKTKKYSTDKGSRHSYLEVYENFISRDIEALLEIGINRGGSLRLFRDYLTIGNVYGIDIRSTRMILNEKRIQTFCLDSSNAATVNKTLPSIKFDIIIDDGNHKANFQIKTFSALRSFLNKGAYYIIEDIQNIDRDINLFLEKEDFTVIDLRKKKNRFDDVLLIYQNK